MITIDGFMETGEAQVTTRAIRARLYGASFGTIVFIIASLVVGIATGAGVVLALAIDKILDRPNFALPIFIVAIATSSFLSMRLCQRWSVNRFRQNMQIRGMHTSFKCSFSIADDQLIQETDWMCKIAPWSSVTEIIRSQKYWIFMVGFEPWFVPSRFFSSAEEERNFLVSSLTHLSADAKARSRDASVFAGS